MASGSYWCYSCSRFVWVSDSISCPDCDGGFLEHIQESLDFTPSDSFHRVTSQHRSPTRFPPSSSASMHASTAENSPTPTSAAASVTRTRSNRSPNPVIVLRGSGPSDVSEGLDRSAFQMYYDDGTDSGLRPLPPSMTEFLLGSGFDRLLDQISQIELNTNRNIRSCEHPPASKSAIEALPVIEIDPTHLQSDSQSHCAVCKENFVLKSSAREMPCNHIYHPDCILPWLAIRNSCPVCRHELPAEDITDGTGAPLTVTAAAEEEEDSAAGLTIWRLPGGGFAVGRIPGGWRGGDRMMPVVYTEVDGGRLGDERLPRRVAWGSRRGGRDGGSRERGGGFAGRIMRLFGCFSGSSGFIAAARERLTLGMGDFLSEMAAMMNNSKPSENNTGDSFEQLQDLLNEMFQGDPGAFSSSSCSTSNFTSSCSFVFDTNNQQSSFEASSMGINNDPFGFDPRAHHAFSLGVDHQQDFKKGKNNGGRRNRRKNNVPSAAHETSSNNNYGVPTS